MAKVFRSGLGTGSKNLSEFKKIGAMLASACLFSQHGSDTFSNCPNNAREEQEEESRYDEEQKKNVELAEIESATSYMLSKRSTN